MNVIEAMFLIMFGGFIAGLCFAGIVKGNDETDIPFYITGGAIAALLTIVGIISLFIIP